MAVEGNGAVSVLSSQDVRGGSTALAQDFPENNLHFLKYLTIDKSIGEQTLEYLMAVNDAVLAFQERIRLHNGNIYTGEGIPHGSGPLVIVRGFGTTEGQYEDTANFFEKVGYEVHIFGVDDDFNTKPIAGLDEKLISKLQEIPGKKNLFTHSKGGLLTYATYVTHMEEFREEVGHVVFAGSPKPNWVNFAIGFPYLVSQIPDIIRFRTDDFEFAHSILHSSDVENIDGVFVTSIGNPADAIIRGQMIGKPNDQYKLSCSHSGMHWNEDVLMIAARRYVESDIVQFEVA